MDDLIMLIHSLHELLRIFLDDLEAFFIFFFFFP